MIKSKRVKRFLSKTIFKGLSAINQVVSKDDSLILMYSNLGFRDNVEYLYQYLIKNNYNSKYKIVRSHKEESKEKLPANVTVVSNAKAVIYFLRAGHVFYCFGKLPIYPSKGQDVVQMWHGSPFKGADEWQIENSKERSYYTKYVLASDYFREIAVKYQGATNENIVICGQPRTDAMFENNTKYQELQGFDKVVIWMPTFRSATALGYQDVNKGTNIIPLFDPSDYDTLNRKLEELGVCLIVKMHPSQDVDSFDTKYRNLFLLTNAEFNQKKWNLYRLLGQCDALITDYSSVFYDFMLLDRPMAFTIDDLNEYKNNRGFAVDDPDYITAGYKLKTKEDMYSFLSDLVAGKDDFVRQRHEVNALVNTYNDGQQCKRLLNLTNITMEKRRDKS